MKLDAAKKPKTVDVTITKGRDKGKKQYGLYQVDADTLKFCFAAPEKELAVVEGATHLFEEPGALEEVAWLATDWFQRHLRGPTG